MSRRHSTLDYVLHCLAGLMAGLAIVGLLTMAFNLDHFWR